jgi:hypothetical protein
MWPLAIGQPQYANGQPQYANAQQPYPNAIPYVNVMPYNGQYGVQQLYPSQPYPNYAVDQFGTTSVSMPILCCGGSML